MQAYKSLDNRKPEAQAVMLTPLKPFRLFETLEDMRQKVWRNADTGVRNDDPRIVADSVHLDMYRTAGFGELDAVGNQVPEDLFDSGLDSEDKDGRIRNP